MRQADASPLPARSGLQRESKVAVARDVVTASLLFDGVVGRDGTVKGAEPAVWAIGRTQAVLVCDELRGGDDAPGVVERLGRPVAGEAIRDADPARRRGRHRVSLVEPGL